MIARHLPADLILPGLIPGNVFEITNASFTQNRTHKFIVVGVVGEKIYLVCCIRDKDEYVQKLINKGILPNSTLVPLSEQSKAELKFTETTFVNCNTIHEITFDDFKNYHKTLILDVYPDITKADLHQIAIGIYDSPKHSKIILSNIIHPDNSFFD